jgi:hypothetical protein
MMTGGTRVPELGFIEGLQWNGVVGVLPFVQTVVFNMLGSTMREIVARWGISHVAYQSGWTGEPKRDFLTSCCAALDCVNAEEYAVLSIFPVLPPSTERRKNTM